MSSLPRNLVVKKLLDRLERIAFVKVNSEEYYAVAALEERKSYLIMRIDKCYLFGCRKEEGSHSNQVLHLVLPKNSAAQ